MATGSVQKGQDLSGPHVATDTFTEDAVTKHAQRVGLCNAAGKNIVASAGNFDPTSVTADGTPAIKLAASNTRVGFYIQNRGTDSIFMGYGSGLTTANGIEIFPNAGYVDKGIGVFQGDVYLVAASGTQNVRIQAW